MTIYVRFRPKSLGQSLTSRSQSCESKVVVSDEFREKIILQEP